MNATRTAALNRISAVPQKLTLLDHAITLPRRGRVIKFQNIPARWRLKIANHLADVG
jgi:hypothetical protein